MIIIICIVLLILFIVWFNKKNNVIEGLNTFNGRMAIDDQYFYDKLFDDVVYYQNDYEKKFERAEEIGKLLRTGWEKCKLECPGHCVEYFLSGNAYCFPY